MPRYIVTIRANATWSMQVNASCETGALADAFDRWDAMPASIRAQPDTLEADPRDADIELWQGKES